MDRNPATELSIGRVSNALGSDDGYDLWFDLPAHPGDETSPEFRTLCQGSILVGHIAGRMGWDWPTVCRSIHRIAAPLEEFLLIEVSHRTFRSAPFRRAVGLAVPASGLDPYKVKVMDADHAEAYILGHGLPPI